MEFRKTRVDQRHVRICIGSRDIGLPEPWQKFGHCCLGKSRQDICRQASIGIPSIETSINTQLTRSRYNEKPTDPIVRT